MRITELFTAQSIALDEAQQDRSQIIDRLVELQATHGNIRDKEAYKKGLYEREDEGSTYVDNGITVPHAKCDCVTRPSLAALRLKTPVQYNAEDDGKTDLLFAIAAPKNGSLHVDMLARMMQMLMNEDFVEKLRTAKTPEEFLAAIDAQEEAQFGDESFTDQEIGQAGYRVLAVTACVNGIAHTYMAAEALNKAGAKMGVTIKVETNGSDGAKNILTKDEIANCDGIIVAAEKKIETARFDGKPVLFTRVDDGIHKPEELIHKITSGEVPEHRAFIYETALPRLEQLGIPVRVLRSDKTYLDLFAGTVTRGPKKGLRRGFPLCGHCYVQRDCKLRPIRRYNRTLTPDTVQYVGIASDEPVRLRRLQKNQVSLLEKYHYTEEDAKQLCQTAGLLSPVYAFTDRGGCWFCPNAKRKELRHLYDHHPELWARMLELQAMPGKVSEKFNRTERFSDIDAAFRKEDALCQKAA